MNSRIIAEIENKGDRLNVSEDCKVNVEDR